MGLLNIIRRMHLREKLSMREIARRTGLSRNTVTRHLAASTIEPRFATPDRSSKLDPFAAPHLSDVAAEHEDILRHVHRIDPADFDLRIVPAAIDNVGFGKSKPEMSL